MLAIIDLLTPAAFALTRLLTAAAIYFAVLKAGIALARACEKEVFAKLPLLELLAKSIGITLTVLVFTKWYAQGAFSIDTLFGPESYWRRDLAEFLREAANPFSHIPFEALADTANLSSLLFYALIVLFLLVLVVFLPARDVPRILFVSLIYIGLTVYTFVYAAAFLLWSLYTLNFWGCIVAILLLTSLRRRSA